MDSLIKRADKAGLNVECMLKNAMKIVESYANSGCNGNYEALPDLYKKIIIAQIEVFEDTKDPLN